MTTDNLRSSRFVAAGIDKLTGKHVSVWQSVVFGYEVNIKGEMFKWFLFKHNAINFMNSYVPERSGNRP